MTIYHAEVVGKGWYGQTIATEYTWDDSNVTPPFPTDDYAIDYYLEVGTGDFQEVLGARVRKVVIADCGHRIALLVHDFTEDSELLYNDCMFGNDE